MADYPIENLLRSPVEWWSAVAGLLFSASVWHFSDFFLLQPGEGKLTAVFLAGLSFYRFWQGYCVFHYQRYIRKLPKYVMSSKALPMRRHQLFLGKGFKWEAIHTQRLYDLKKHPNIKKITHAHKTELGGLSILHGVEPKEKKVFMNLAERVGHTLVIGTTRVGKTRFAEVLAAQDIRRGEVTIIFDPKGDTELLRRIVFECQQANRLSDLFIFHLGFPEVSARYNPIGSFARITEVANRVANQLPSSGESAAFREFAWRFVNIIAGALVALNRKPSYRLINEYILNIDPLLWQYCESLLPALDEAWQEKVMKFVNKIDERNLPFHLKARPKKMIGLMRYLETLNIEDNVLKGLSAIFNYDKTYYQKITASLSPLLEKLTTGDVAELISPDYSAVGDERPIFDWLQVIKEKKVVYIGLDALSDATVATAVGNSMFADLCSVAGQLYKFGVEGESKNGSQVKQFHPVNIHADEFNELMGDEFVPLLNKAGGAGVQVTAYTQTISDIEARLGNKAKTGQVLGNLNTVISLRVLEEQTANFFVNKLAQRVQVKEMVHGSSVNDASSLQSDNHFSTHQSDQLRIMEVPMLSADDLLQLPKGQAFCLLAGGQLWKIRMPLAKDDMSAIPMNMLALSAFIKQQAINEQSNH